MPTVQPAAARPAALAKHPMLAGADPAALERLARHAVWRLVELDGTVLEFGDPSAEVFFVFDGLLRVQLRTADGQEMILNDIGANGVFGELAAIDGAPRSASISALHRTQLCMVPGPLFLECVLASPVVALRLMRMLVARLRGKDEQVLELATLPVRKRLMAELLRLSRPRADGSGQRVVSPPPPHHVLGARIGARREAVSREISSLVRAGWVEADRRAIRLRKPEALHRELDGHLPRAQ